MNPNSSSDLEFFLHFESLFGTDMNWCHEPAWFVCANGKEPNIKSCRKLLFDRIDKFITVSGISSKVKTFVYSLNISDITNESSPMGFVSVGDPSSRKVLSWYKGDFDSIFSLYGYLCFLPIHFFYLSNPAILEVFFISKTCIDHWIILLFESSKRIEIHMIVVVVGEKYDVDFGKLVKINSRFNIPMRSCPAKWTRTISPYWISQDIDIVDLYQHGSMSHKGHTHSINIIVCCW